MAMTVVRKIRVIPSHQPNANNALTAPSKQRHTMKFYPLLLMWWVVPSGSWAFCPSLHTSHVQPIVLRNAGGIAARKESLLSLFSAVEVRTARSASLDDNVIEHNKEPGQKLKRLKDLMWVRETLEDLTAAEFACTVEAHDNKVNKRKRAVDYEKLVNQLNKRLSDMGCNIADAIESADFECSLSPDLGMGRLTYTEMQRTNLLQRLVRTRQQLIEVVHGNEIDVDSDNLPFLSLPELPKIELPKEEIEEDTLGPKLYVRDDGTVDWDGALQDKTAMREFGTAVWARINGRDLDNIEDDNHSPAEQVTAKIVDTPAIQHARQRLDSYKSQLVQMEKEHINLLNSAISQGQATANIKLASLDKKLRSQIQASAAALESIKIEVSFQTLIYELERIYTYLMGELGNPAINGYIPLQDRLNVAEFGLLESQIDSFNSQFLENETVDEDVLAVVFEQLTDFKRRLGIDYYVAGFSFDRENVAVYLNDLWIKTKKGLAFYSKGVQLFWNDIVFCLRLINRAAQGYTLKPREVRNIRRTFKDVITFIPFVIILLIPLSPIGHVLVFGAIQRFFPDFFPSCFTEQRQNLLQLYETAEYSELTINETWAVSFSWGSFMPYRAPFLLQKKLTRFSEAFVYIVANSLRQFYFKVLGLTRKDGGGGNNDTTKKS